LTATIVVTNLVANGFTRIDFLGNYFSLANWGFGYPLLGRISEMTALILLSTSNIWSMKKLGKNWKRIQRLSYLYFISGGLVAAQFEPVWYYGTMGVVGVVYGVIYVRKRFKS
ncbi:hypothetical protein MK079_05640, partial [Candidatus Gracilibacteria bacterium]|nr:hypothetical protein [Candidatus Gracilibacteria bacterium]